MRHICRSPIPYSPRQDLKTTTPVVAFCLIGKEYAENTNTPYCLSVAKSLSQQLFHSRPRTVPRWHIPGGLRWGSRRLQARLRGVRHPWTIVSPSTPLQTPRTAPRESPRFGSWVGGRLKSIHDCIVRRTVRHADVDPAFRPHLLPSNCWNLGNAFGGRSPSNR